MKKLLLLILVASALICKSQNYSYQSIPYHDNSNNLTTIQLATDDIFSNIMPIGFNFEFYGKPYSSLVIGTNGLISFDTTVAGTGCIWDLSNKTVDDLYQKSVFLTYQDIDVTLGGSISYGIAGIAPYRKFIVTYDSVPFYNSDVQFSTCNQTIPYSGYLVLYEKSNAIEFYIKQKDYCDTAYSFHQGWNDGLAISGLHDTTGASVILPNRGLNTLWTANNEAWRFCPNSQCVNYDTDSLNIVSGKLYYDLNSNCAYDTEILGYNKQLKLDSIPVTTDNFGNYAVYADTGWHTLSVISTSFRNCVGDSSVNIYFPNYNDTSSNNDFTDTVFEHTCPKRFINIGTWGLIACASNGYIKIRYGNDGVYDEDSVDITLTLNDSMHIIYSPVPNVNLGSNQYRFHIVSTIHPGQVKSLFIKVGTGCDTIGTTYCFSASIHSFNNACINAVDTISYECTNLLASFDPNVKLVGYQDYEHKGYTTYEEIDSTNSLLYKICFQNTGNAPAQTVILRDTLANYLDPSSIKFIASSHTYSFDVTGQVLTITYNDINLVDSSVSQTESTGWVRFSINQIAGNTEGTTINNRAGIYFDSNPVVTTNTVTNLIPASVVLALDNLNNQDISVLVYPNPFSEDALLTVKGEKGINNLHLTIYDMVGRVVNNYQSASNSLIINRKGLSAGVYFYSVTINNELTKTGLLKVF